MSLRAMVGDAGIEPDRVVGTVQEAADQIITGALRTAIERVLAEAADAAPAFAPVADLDDRQLLAARDEHRAAALSVDRLAAQYSTIRRVQGVLSAGRVMRDTAGLWAEFENLAAVYGNHWPGRNQSAWRPARLGIAPGWPGWLQETRLRLPGPTWSC